ncbi:MAG: UvrD-helicase domain-containing protein [Bacteroidales bacterium]
MEDYLNELNEQQRAAVEYNDGPSLVIAGAGSGKTRVLTYKIVHLLNSGYDAGCILALTFTNKAAAQMKERITDLVGYKTSSRLWMGTFHSIFSRILRFNAERIGFKQDYTIYDTADSRSLIKMIIKDMGLDDKVYKLAAVQSHISNLKNALISPENYAADNDFRQADTRAKRPQMYAIYRAYWQRCFVSNAMDFDDLLFYTNILLRDNPDIRKQYQEHFRYILVDEYQDTNFAQHLIVLQLCKGGGNLCVVGDDAQSIYSFRGANIRNILNMKGQYPTLRTFKLEQNYRSTQNIINAANSLIEKNREQIRKHIFSTNQEGSKVKVLQAYSDYEESYLVANQISEIRMLQDFDYCDFAVLYRTNAQSRILEESLRKRNIPYKIYGGLSFYQRKEIKDAIAYFRMCINPNDDEALKRIINYPARGIGDTTVGKLQQAAIHHNKSIWEVIGNVSTFDDIKINSGTANKLANFHALISEFIQMNTDKVNAYDLTQHILNKSQILASLYNDNTPENISKQENISELLNGVQEFITAKSEEGEENQIFMSNFLSEISLATDQDKNSDKDDANYVTLMTVHAAKGLEFKNIIIVGVEEDLFPSSMNMESISAIEEERRLLYVAITRAEINCVITFATSRFQNGQTKISTSSRFLKDIDPEYLTMWQGSDVNSNRFGGSKSSTFNSGYKQSPPRFSKSSPTLSSNFKRVSNATTPKATTASNEGGRTHTATELSVGMRISHNRFGIGVIENIDTINSDAKINVNFENIGTKNLLLKFAKFTII